MPQRLLLDERNAELRDRDELLIKAREAIEDLQASLAQAKSESIKIKRNSDHAHAQLEVGSDASRRLRAVPSFLASRQAIFPFFSLNSVVPSTSDPPALSMCAQTKTMQNNQRTNERTNEKKQHTMRKSLRLEKEHLLKSLQREKTKATENVERAHLDADRMTNLRVASSTRDRKSVV